MGKTWTRRAAGALLVVAVVCVAAVVLFVLPGLSWWPGWPVIGAWWRTWWLAVAAGIAAVGAVVLWHRSAASASTAGTASAADAARSQLDWSKVTAVVTSFTALAALVFTAQSLGATRNQIAVSEQGQITDRYTTAVDQIGTQGADRLETRLGGVYALERLMHDSPRDQPTIVEVLSAFIRSGAHRRQVFRPGQPDGCPNQSVTLDIQAALTVLGRRNPGYDQSAVVDLDETCLEGVDLRNAHFAHANLDAVDLASAAMSGADLSQALLVDVNFASADLSYANLSSTLTTDDDFTNATTTGMQH